MTWLLEWWLFGVVATLIVAVGVVGWHVSRWLAYHRARSLPGPEITPEAVRNEIASLVEIGWLRLLRSRASDLALPSERRGRTVALVHGYWDQAASFWKLREYLAELGRPTVGIELGWQLGALERYATRLAESLQRIIGEESDGIDVIAHSMGGIVLRMVLRDHPDLRDAIHHVVTLGTPHRGTGAVDRLNVLLPEMKALSEDSELLAELPTLSELLSPDRVVTAGGTFDLIVYPVENTFDPAGRNVSIPAVGHGGLLTDTRVLDLLRDALSDQTA